MTTNADEAGGEEGYLGEDKYDVYFRDSLGYDTANVVPSVV